MFAWIPETQEQHTKYDILVSLLLLTLGKTFSALVRSF